ncbi:SpoIIE family protein phosphatase [Maridesulfovibrio zosterae]|uniref:SpoIIE family protein phosphatase n=1 Tax=Maridesulfovibrio zosterae TaxID=82171 RepID=UPI0004054155|nr:SpoIIE family protein phosphatase [Maridesulfovibrio zosterae]
MKIRWKILIILLIFSLMPLVVTRLYGLRSLTELGSDLQIQTRLTLLERATESLSSMAKGRAAIINLESRLYHTSLKSIQAEAEIRLSSSELEPSIPDYYVTSPHSTINNPEFTSAPDYKKRALMGKGANRKKTHDMTEIKRGALIDLPITKERISFWLTDGLTLKQAEPYIKKLSPMLTSFKNCSATLEKLVLWQEITLENGLVATYPGHDSFPGKYDPRKNAWYKKVKKQKKTLWNLPVPDAATRSLCHRLTAPLFNDNGEFIGTTSLVIAVSMPIHGSLIHALQPGTTLMVVASENPESFSDSKLLIIGKAGDRYKNMDSVQAQRHFWQSPPDQEWLKENNPEFRTLVQDINDGHNGVIQMNYKGVPSLWTFSPINNTIALLLITPTTDFTAEADEAEQYVRESIANQYEGTSLIAIVVILCVSVVAYFVSQSLSRPIRMLSEAVIKIGKGDWSVRADFHSSDELGELAENFNIMVPQLREHSATKQALILADEAQKSLFPQATPKIDGVDIGARCTFSEKTGGDYYDFIGCKTCGPSVFATAIGDVSGHGITAALLMTSARAYTRAYTGQGNSLVWSVKNINRLVTKDCMQTGHFMTMFTATCDLNTKKLHWIRAGHDPALIYTPQTDSFTELKGTGMALGVDEDYVYEEHITQIQTGQILVLYTDGIWEAHSPAGIQFGKDYLRQIICENCHKPAQEIVDLLLLEVQNHRRGLPLEDDCTAIVIKFI